MWAVGGIFQNLSKSPVALDAVAGKSLTDSGAPTPTTGNLTCLSETVLPVVLGISLGEVN